MGCGVYKSVLKLHNQIFSRNIFQETIILIFRAQKNNITFPKDVPQKRNVNGKFGPTCLFVITSGMKIGSALSAAKEIVVIIMLL